MAPLTPAPAAAPPAATMPVPPSGYGYSYYPLVPLTPVEPAYPEDSSVRSSPFADLVAASMSWDRRFSANAVIGAQVGAFLADRLRLAARVTFLTNIPLDTQEDFFRSSPAATFFYGATAGVAVYRGPVFVLAPGVLFQRTNESDYGSMLGLSLPFEWVTHAGVRLGFEADVGRAFGGQEVTPGERGPLSFEHRKAGPAAWFQINVGFGLFHPTPLRAPLPRPPEVWPTPQAAPPPPAPVPAVPAPAAPAPAALEQ